MQENQIPRAVTIVYRRLPNDTREFPGTLREQTSDRLVIESPIIVAHPVRFERKVIADKGYLAIWFVFKSKWYDVAKFYDRKRRWIGYYCDIVKPLSKLLGSASRTSVMTDLYLDLWITPDGKSFVLDEDELENAVRNKYISTSLARQARRQVDSLIRLVKKDRFPPFMVRNIEPLNRRNTDSS